MDPKFLKQSLKEAKEAIKNNKHSDAIKLCKAILREDRKNYMALVLFGAALQETEQKAQAPNAYRKAIELNPEHPLAWQGLVSYFEKDDTESGKAELLTAYQKLIELESDSKKVLELTNKLAQMAQKLGQVHVVVSALRSQQAVVQDDPERLLDTWCRIASILSSSQTLTNDLSEQLEEALSKIINNTSSMENMENLRKYLKVLYKHKKLDLLAKWCLQSREMFPKAEFPMEWACRAYSVYGNNNTEQLNNLFPNFCDNLLAMNVSSGLGMLGKGAFFKKQRKIVEARDILIEGAKALPTSVNVWSLLAECHLRLANAEDAEQCATLALNLLTQPNDKATFSTIQYILIKALSISNQEEKLLLAVSKCREILQVDPKDVTVLTCLVQAFISLKNNEEADSVLNALNTIKSDIAIAMRALILAKQGYTDEVNALLRENNLEDGSTNKEIIAKVWLELGNHHWENNNQISALSLYLKAANVDSLYYTPFLKLGDYYRLNGQDQDRARRCYQKAFRLNPRCEEAGTRLSDIYRTQKNMDANLELLTTAANNGTGGKWVWQRLGLLFLQMGNVDEAINKFLAILRSDPQDSLCWESLGDAYMVRGSFTAAVKAFEKVLELSPNALYPAIQIANVKLLLGQLVEAENEFKVVLQQCTDYVPALKGLGETFLTQAKDYLKRQLFGLARDKFEEALHILTRAVKLQVNLSCVWKLMGDACFLATQLGPLAYLEVCTSLLGGKVEHRVRVDCLQLLQLATRCYCRVLSFNKEDSLAWHDLAIAYHNQAHNSPESEGWLEKALAAAKQACQLLPANSEHWNLLGFIAAEEGLKKYKLSQHAFIRAIQICPSNVQAWSNLGTLYLSLGDIELAHQAYSVAQSTEPSFVECWIGQALIAEKIEHSDAMDLFLHSTQLSTHPEGSIGYAHWVCSLFSKKQQDSLVWRQAMATATDELTWFTGRTQNNACAYNLLGLLLERQGLLKGATTALEKALNLEDEGTQANKIRVNVSRVLSSLGRNSEAIDHLKQLTEASFHSQCILALAYFKNEQYQESYTAYDSASHWLAQDDEQKSNILVAKAAMAYKFQGPEGAKSLLFQCAQLQPASVRGLFASCALGMLHKDLQLSKLVLKELQSYADDPLYMTDVSLFQAYIYFLQRQWVESVRGLCKVIHRHPEQATLWLSLAVLLLNMYPDAPSKASAPCARNALLLGRTRMDISKVQSLVALSHLQSGNTKRSLIEAQRAIHLYPDQAEGWAVLIAAVLPRCIANQSKKEASWLSATVGFVRRHLNCSSRALSQWLSNNERKASLLCEQLE